MIDWLYLVFWPIIYVLGKILDLFFLVSSSWGVSIIALSLLFSLILLPVKSFGMRVEKRISSRKIAAQKEAAQKSEDLLGEEKFLATEEVYKSHKYHPIQDIGLSASFLVILPILISVVLLFTSENFLSTQTFLFFEDISQPYTIFGFFNALPLLMFAITMVEAQIRYKDDKSSRVRFYLISFVLLIIIYEMPTSVVLYWITSNLVSLTSAITDHYKKSTTL